MIAKLTIEVQNRESITWLKETYFSAPFKLANITEDKHSKTLHLMIMNSSPGILDDDEYFINVDVKENASLHLHTQSYQRVFNMKKGAKQLTEVHLGKNSSFIYLPHPSVPHENASFVAANKIFMEETSMLIWGEILTCGRKLSKQLSSAAGEIFSFSKFHNITEIFLHNKLVIRENLYMEPSSADPRRLGQLEGYTHQASLICLKPGVFDTDEVHTYLSAQEDILSGMTTTPSNGMLVRILGHGAEQLHHHLQALSFLVQQQHRDSPAKKLYAE